LILIELIIEMKFIKGISTVVLLLICVSTLNGQNPTDFNLVSATDNREFNLSETQGKYVALHFLLKTECPVCIRHTQEYFNNAETLPEVIQVFIKPDTDDDIEAWANKLSKEDLADFPIYRDPDAKLASQYNITDGYNFHDQVVHFPALILLDPNGKEVFRYIGKSNRDRYSFAQLETKISELRK